MANFNDFSQSPMLYNSGFEPDVVRQYNYEDTGGGLPSMGVSEPQQPAQNNYIDALSKQILGQNLTGKWTGAGYGSAEANAADMAKILAGIGITDINQFGQITRPVELYMGTDESGNPIYQTQDEQTYGNKLTGQVVPTTYSERQKGNFWGGTFAGKGNTGYGVQFDEQGNPLFYTQGASSSDVGKLAPFLAMAQFIPGLQPFAAAANAAIAAGQGNVLGALAGAAGLGGYSDVANAANFAGAVKSGNPLGILSAGANLGGADLSGVADAAGLGDLNNIGGYNVNDAVKMYQTAKAIQSGDPSAIISAVGGYAMGNQGDQGTPPPADNSYVPFPSEVFNPSSERPAANLPVDSSINTDDMETRRITTPDLSTLLPELPSIVAEEPPVAAPQAPEAPRLKDYSGISYNSAFAQARAGGDKEFTWNGREFNTNLAPNKPAYDSVGGGRGVQGGPTAEQLASYTGGTVGKLPTTPSEFAQWATSIFPSAEAGALPKSTYSPVSEIPGYGGPVPSSTNDQNNSMAGRFADELGLPQEFQRNFGNTLNALPGLNFPVGVLGRGVGAAEEALGGLSSAGKYAPEATRLSSNDPMKLFKAIDQMPVNSATRETTEKAMQLLASGDNLGAYQLLNANPATRTALQQYSGARGYQELSPFKVTEGSKLFNPAQYLKNTQDKYVSNPVYPRRSK
jgi:hypothetical protein